MKKRVVVALGLWAFVFILLNFAMGGQQLYPKKIQGLKSANLSPTRASAKITLSKNEVKRVEEPLDIEQELENEEFCDSLEILACCIEAEAGNQDLLGKRLVCDVILNRVDSERFPNTIEEVIKQKYHFTTFWDGTMATIVPSEETFEAVQMELKERTDSEILFFTAGDYNTFCIPAYKHGDHYFGY